MQNFCIALCFQVIKLHIVIISGYGYNEIIELVVRGGEKLSDSFLLPFI